LLCVNVLELLAGFAESASQAGCREFESRLPLSTL
jgi:hypothetical protein